MYILCIKFNIHLILFFFWPLKLLGLNLIGINKGYLSVCLSIVLQTKVSISTETPWISFISCLFVFPIKFPEKMAQAENPTDIIVVLGSRTNEDGSATEMMKSRVKRAAELYSSLKQQNIDCRVIVTGYQAPDQVIDSCPNVPSTFRILPSFMVSLMVVLLIASLLYG